MSPRSVPEWVGKNSDQRVPARVCLRIWRRQCGENNFAICPLSKLPIRDTDEKHLDHEKALIDGGEHREANLRFVRADAHRIKTADEVARKARVDDRAKAHLRMDDIGPLAVPKAVQRARKEARSRDRNDGRIAVPAARPLFVEGR